MDEMNAKNLIKQPISSSSTGDGNDQNKMIDFSSLNFGQKYFFEKFQKIRFYGKNVKKCQKKKFTKN